MVGNDESSDQSFMNINLSVKGISMHSNCNMEILEYHSVMGKSLTHALKVKTCLFLMVCQNTNVLN